MMITAIHRTKQKDRANFYFEPTFEDEGFAESLMPWGDWSERFAANTHSKRLLSHEEERTLFQRFNYLKYLQSRIEQHGCCPDTNLGDLLQVERLVRLLRAGLVESNLRLVASLARRLVSSSSPDYGELISHGSEALIRAVERYDYRLGYRFSTYAYQAIRCAMFGWLRTQKRRREQMPTVSSDSMQLAECEDVATVPPVDTDEKSRQVARLLASLDERDREIVEARFGLDCPNAEPAPFRTISKRVGLSTTRVVQRYQRAMDRLRSAGGFSV